MTEDLIAPCRQYEQSAELVEKACHSLDPVPERVELERIARQLRSAAREVHTKVCVSHGATEHE